MVAITGNGTSLRFAIAGVGGFVLVAITCNGRSLVFASQELQKDCGFVLASVKVERGSIL